MHTYVETVVCVEYNFLIDIKKNKDKKAENTVHCNAY